MTLADLKKLIVEMDEHNLPREGRVLEVTDLQAYDLVRELYQYAVLYSGDSHRDDYVDSIVAGNIKLANHIAPHIYGCKLIISQE